jgi:hypothetical protein
MSLPGLVTNMIRFNDVLQTRPTGSDNFEIIHKFDEWEHKPTHERISFFT